MRNTTLSNATTQLTINDVTVTLNFSEERNTDTENAVAQLLIERLFARGCSSRETSQDAIPQLDTKTMRKAS